MKTLDDLQCEGKTVLVRVDINAPVSDGVAEASPRFREAAETIRELANKKARVVVLAHQGRAGDADFIPLKQHAELLSKQTRKRVKYVDDLFGSKALAEIGKLKDGKILLLENVRFYAEETLDAPPEKLAQTIFVSTLAKQAQAFVNDAFSAAHRGQASLVGFPELLPSYAGRAMAREHAAISKVAGAMERPVVFVLGGAKPDDCFKLLKYAAENNKADYLLTSGVIGELCLLVEGRDMGAKRGWLEEKGYTKILPELEQLVKKHGAKIKTPVDFAYKDSDGIRAETDSAAGAPVFDIGSRTARAYAEIIKRSRAVYFKGPVGAYEQPQFELGTRIVLKAIESSHAFSLLGGGHTLSAMEKFGINRKKIGHVSTAGGAVVAFLSGGKLPAIEALERSAQKNY